MLDQIKASDQWNYYQAKGIKGALLSGKVELLNHFEKAVSGKDEEKLKEYRQEQSKIYDEAKEKEASSRTHLKKHEVLARSVTLFQVAIALGAISVLSRRKYFWFVSLGFGVIGVGFFIQELFY